MATFVYESLIAAPVGEVFAFHERPDALEHLAPPWQRVEVRRRTGGLEIGAEVELRVWLGPLPTTWLARHTEYEQGKLFVDVQVRGPFRRWTHRHEFTAAGNGTQLTDRVDYGTWAGPPGDWLARRALRRLFAWRHEATRRAVTG